MSAYTQGRIIFVMPHLCYATAVLVVLEKPLRNREYREEEREGKKILHAWVDLLAFVYAFWMIYIVNISELGSPPSPEMTGWWRQWQMWITLSKLLVQHPHRFPHYHIQTSLNMFLSHCASVCILMSRVFFKNQMGTADCYTGPFSSKPKETQKLKLSLTVLTDIVLQTHMTFSFFLVNYSITPSENFDLVCNVIHS